jgi:3-oxoacyl-[acyl-carrier-protein] synthase-3
MDTATVSAPARIAAFGMSAPDRVLSNADFEKMVDTSDEWIVQRTGIHERRAVNDDEYSSHLAIRAVEDLLASSPSISLDSIDYIIAASTTPDYVYPSLSAMLQAHYGLRLSVGAIDISAACAGFAYGINLACGLIASGQCNRVLVVASEALTRTIDYTDRATSILFGDGAGAAVVERSGQPSIFGMDAGADGTAGAFLYRTNVRVDINGTIDPSRLLRQNGREVYRWVLANVPNAIARILDRSGLTMDDIDWFVPHSANERMIEALNKRLGFPMERTLLSIGYYGNTSAASIPLALVPALRDGRVKSGDKLLLIGFGGGLVNAGCVAIAP